VIKLLEKQTVFPIARAQMRLLIESPRGALESILKAIQPLVSEIEGTESSTVSAKITVLIDPGQFRGIHEIVSKTTKNQASIITLNLRVSDHQ
jgi:hypothetical protein